jgi:DNA-binding NarL/FixJ family response regulator
MITIAVVDDHPLMIEAIESLLRRTKGFEVVGSGATAHDVVELCERIRPQVAVVDLSIPGDVYAAIESGLRISPETKIVAFTASTGVDSAIRALDAGASGYVLKGSNTAELIQAISSVQSGETYITQSFASRVIAGLRDASLRRKAAQAVILSIRERQIIRLLMNGKTNKEIAIAINIREKTVKHYMTVLMQKLQVRNRLEVVLAAQKFNERQTAAGLH